MQVLKDNIKKDPIKVLVLILVFLLPVLMGVLKHSVTAIYVILMFIGLSLWVSNKKITLSKPEKIILWGFVFVFIVFFLGYLNSDDMWAAWKKLGKAGKFLFVIPVYLALKYCRDSLLLGVKMGLICAGPVFLGYLLMSSEGRTVMGAYHSIMYGDFAMLAFGIALLMALLVETKNFHKALLVMSSLMSLAACFLVGARGAWMALPFLLVLLLWSTYRYSHARKGALIVFLLTVFTISAVFITSPAVSKKRLTLSVDNITEYFSQQNNFVKTSEGTRLMLWNVAINIWQKNPLIGTGLGDYKKDKADFIKKKPEYLKLKSYGSVHNVFLEWLAQFGILGFLGLLLFVFLLPFFYFIRVEIMSKATAGIGLIGAWITGSNMMFALTESTMGRSTPIGVFLLFLLIFFALADEDNRIK